MGYLNKGGYGELAKAQHFAGLFLYHKAEILLISNTL